MKILNLVRMQMTCSSHARMQLASHAGPFVSECTCRLRAPEEVSVVIAPVAEG